MSHYQLRLRLEGGLPALEYYQNANLLTKAETLSIVKQRFAYEHKIRSYKPLLSSFHTALDFEKKLMQSLWQRSRELSLTIPKKWRLQGYDSIDFLYRRCLRKFNSRRFEIIRAYVEDLLQSRRMKRLLRFLTREIERDPTNAQLWSLAIRSIQSLRTVEQLRFMLRRALQFAPSSLELCHGLIELEVKYLGRLVEMSAKHTDWSERVKAVENYETLELVPSHVLLQFVRSRKAHLLSPLSRRKLCTEIIVKVFPTCAVHFGLRILFYLWMLVLQIDQGDLSLVSESKEIELNSLRLAEALTQLLSKEEQEKFIRALARGEAKTSQGLGSVRQVLLEPPEGGEDFVHDIPGQDHVSISDFKYVLVMRKMQGIPLTGLWDQSFQFLIRQSSTPEDLCLKVEAFLEHNASTLDQLSQEPVRVLQQETFEEATQAEINPSLYHRVLTLLHHASSLPSKEKASQVAGRLVTCMQRQNGFKRAVAPILITAAFIQEGLLCPVSLGLRARAKNRCASATLSFLYQHHSTNLKQARKGSLLSLYTCNYAAWCLSRALILHLNWCHLEGLHLDTWLSAGTQLPAVLPSRAIKGKRLKHFACQQKVIVECLEMVLWHKACLTRDEPHAAYISDWISRKRVLTGRGVLFCLRAFLCWGVSPLTLREQLTLHLPLQLQESFKEEYSRFVNASCPHGETPMYEKLKREGILAPREHKPDAGGRVSRPEV